MKRRRRSIPNLVNDVVCMAVEEHTDNGDFSILDAINRLDISDFQKRIIEDYYGIDCGIDGYYGYGCNCISKEGIAEKYRIGLTQVNDVIETVLEMLRHDHLFCHTIVRHNEIEDIVLSADVDDAVLNIDELPFFVREALTKHGYRYLNDLEGIPRKTLQRIKGIGPKEAQVIASAMELYGVCIP